MVERSTHSLASLYHDDETAWLESMAHLVSERRFEELDHEHLHEYLLDMARRDKREVLSRLTVLLAHLLKWEHQPDQQTNSWRATILHQRQELRDLLESRTLHNYAEEILSRAYGRAVQQAAAEAGVEESAFPASCPWSLAEVVPEE
jgi:hypothetical protein